MKNIIRQKIKKVIIDTIILVDNFKNIVKKDIQKKLLDLNTIFVHNRYFWVYCNFKEIEKEFLVPNIWDKRNAKIGRKGCP